MRRVIRSGFIGVLCATAAAGVLAQPPTLLAPASSPPKTWIHLDGAVDLEHLRATNFDHYLRARRILAAANEICQPGPAQSYATRFAAERPDCRSMLWLTSDPPKKLLSFRLDDVGYLAIVSVTVSGGRLIGGPLVPVPAPR